METENLLRQLQNLKTWDLFITEESSQPVEFENNQLKRIEQKQSRSAALRVVDEGKIGFSATAHPDHTEELVDRARASAKYGQTAAFEYPATNELPKVDWFRFCHRRDEHRQHG